ncbi:hypothetical protein ACM26W_18955 [Halomonas sp. HK25]|uniref:hypothetical protein n=1 Tax=Halomonas sp. HK25 TaxID=3394321 RepID=UPI0039FBE7F9
MNAPWKPSSPCVAERVMARVGAAAEGVEDPLEALEAMFLAHVAFIAEHPGVPRLLMGQLQHPRPTPASRTVKGLLTNYRQRLAGRGQRLGPGGGAPSGAGERHPAARRHPAAGPRPEPL